LQAKHSRVSLQIPCCKWSFWQYKISSRK